MGFFDRFKKSPTSSEPPAPDGVVVPDGYEVTIFAATLEPGVLHTKGGIIVANLGAASDDPDPELDLVLREVDAALAAASTPAQLVNLNREMKISELLGGETPEIVPFRSPVTWAFHRGGVASIIAEPRRLQALLAAMHRIRLTKGETIEQAVYLVDPPAPAVVPFVRLLYGLGLPVKRPDDQGGTLALHIEVKRPDDRRLCVLAGTPYPIDEPGDDYALAINQQKDRAAEAANDDERRRLATEEQAGLAERVGKPRGTADLVLHAPRLGRLILDMQDSRGDEALVAFETELVARNAALFLMKNPENDSLEIRTYGDLGSALPIFSDLRCLEWAAMDLGKLPGSFVMATIPPRALIAMAAGGKMGLAICTYRDRKTPVYGVLDAARVRALAGNHPEQFSPSR